MTKKQAQILDEIIESLTWEEKRDLILRIERSASNGPTPALKLTPQQKEHMTRAFREIAEMPLENPDPFFGKDDDEVLYGPQAEGPR